VEEILKRLAKVEREAAEARKQAATAIARVKELEAAQALVVKPVRKAPAEIRESDRLLIAQAFSSEDRPTFEYLINTYIRRREARNA
jgi:hypothetical protein